MIENKVYDIAIIGGGLAGLALSIQCVREGYATVLLEKERYPFHKVCGEYVSLESWNFIEELGIPLSQMDLPIIRKLRVTAPNGKTLEQDLPLGGFGISRYRLDAMLAERAKAEGVLVIEEAKVHNISFDGTSFHIQYSGLEIKARVAAGTYGKRANLDIKWKRKFALQKSNKLNNYVGVKYHIKTEWPSDMIALHNFRDGYCGISQVDGGKYCLCYLTTARNLELCNNSISQLEEKVLCLNPALKKIFDHSEAVYGSPLTISQISFNNKTQVEEHVLMIGDSAGMITPLCGNGMSMALHGSKLAFEQIDLFLKNRIPRWQMEQDYIKSWNKQFNLRLRIGRIIQYFFGSPVLSNLLISLLKPVPALVRRLIASTHGNPF